MAKWHGKIGYAIDTEQRSGVWKPVISELEYYGEVIQDTHRNQSSGGVNDDLNITNEISIISDPYVREHFQSMAYVEFMGTNWKVTTVKVLYPRLFISLGGVYRGVINAE